MYQLPKTDFFKAEFSQHVSSSSIVIREMNADEYSAISDSLTHNVYPKYVLESKKTCHAKKNFRVKASQYQIGEDNKIFKVVFSLIIYSEQIY